MNQDKKLHSTASYIAYRSGFPIPASTMSYILQNFWDLKEHRNLLGSYYILRWNPETFQRHLRQGTITRAGITYQVIYHRTDSKEVRDAASLLLSFREPVEAYTDSQAVATVLIAASTKPLEETSTQQELDL